MSHSCRTELPPLPNTSAGWPKPVACRRAAVIRQDNGFDPAAKLRVSFERSLRRALHSLARDKALMVLGEGRPGDPYRYFIHPFVIGMMGDTPEGRALREASKAACAGFEGRYQL
jgi:hypothetical protein